MDENVAQLVYTAAHTPASGSTSGQAAYKGDDTTATVLYTLADHNANVVGLTDDRGRLVAQYSYTPYGELRTAEYFAPDTGSLSTEEATIAARGNKLGHQGLRTERFDRPWDGAMDVGTSVASGGGSAATGAYRALCHNRNRMYDPAEGRFIEQDPNGLGGAQLSDGTAFGGKSAGTGAELTDIASHFSDGCNSHSAYQSSPRMGQDPAGLVFWMVVGQVGSIAEGMFAELGTQYAINLSWDVDWATNWDLPDDAYTRLDSRWVNRSLALGAMRAFADLTDEEEVAWQYVNGPPADFDNDENLESQQSTSGFASDVVVAGSNPRIVHIPTNVRSTRGAARSVDSVHIDGHEIKTFKTKVRGRNATLVEFPKSCVKDEVSIQRTGSRSGDKNEADKAWALKNPGKVKPKNHDWHHGNKPGQMQLIPRKVHQHPKVRHTGGWAIWGRGAR